MYLYHYFERDFDPFSSFAAIPIEKAREILIARKAAGKIGNPDIEGFLEKRYHADKRLYDAFIEHGGQPKKRILFISFSANTVNGKLHMRIPLL